MQIVDTEAYILGRQHNQSYSDVVWLIGQILSCMQHAQKQEDGINERF